MFTKHYWTLLFIYKITIYIYYTYIYIYILVKTLKGIRCVQLDNRKVFSCTRSYDQIFWALFLSFNKLYIHLYRLLTTQKYIISVICCSLFFRYLKIETTFDHLYLTRTANQFSSRFKFLFYCHWFKVSLAFCLESYKKAN